MLLAVPGILIDKERCTRRDEVVLNRVRMGHTLLTHGYLRNDDVNYVAPHYIIIIIRARCTFLILAVPMSE